MILLKNLLKINIGQTWVTSDWGRNGRISRNISSLHIFRLEIFSGIQIECFSRSIRVIRGQTWVKSKSNRGKIGPASWNTSNIYMFWLRILSLIDIQNYLRSDQVIKSHQRSNLSKTCQKRVKSGCLIQLYALNICFDSEFVREFKFIRPLLVKDCAQNWLILPLRPQFDDLTQVWPILIFNRSWYRQNLNC